MALSDTDMAAAIEAAFVAEWLSVKDENLATLGQQERQILFIGIARGILQYLEAHQDEVVLSVTLRRLGTDRTHQVTALNLNI